MTSLQEQLKRLAAPHVQQSLEGKKSSLLFDSREVQAVDREVFFEVASTALKELFSISPRLKKYEELLFHKNQLYVDRTLQDRKFNEKLNKVIKRFLIELSPYFMMKNAQKTLEWLVHHYKIELFNTDDLIMTSLPFHQTNIFVRLLMMLDLSKPSSKWHWMHECAKNGIPLPKTFILSQCKKDSSFLQSIFSMVEEYAEVMGDNNPNLALVVDHCTVIGLLLMERSERVGEEVVSTLVQFVRKGLRSGNPLREVACYPLVATLACQVPLKQDKVLKLAKLISKHHTADSFTIALHCLSVLVSKQQDHIDFPVDLFKHLSLNDLQVCEVEEFAKKCPSSPLLRLLVGADESGSIKALLEKMEKEEEEMEVDEEEGGVDDDSTTAVPMTFLKHLYNQLEAEDSNAMSPFIADLLDHDILGEKDLETIKSLASDISKKVQALDGKAFEAKVQKLQRLDRKFPGHAPIMKYLSGILLSEISKALLTKDASFTLVSCRGLSKLVFKGVYENCSKKVLQEGHAADVYGTVNFKNSESMGVWHYALLLDFVALLKALRQKYPSVDGEVRLFESVFVEMFCGAKDKTTKKDVLNVVLKEFDGSFLASTYCEVLCHLAHEKQSSKCKSLKVQEFVTASKSWFLSLVKKEGVSIAAQVLLRVVLLLANDDADVRAFAMRVVEAYSAKEVSENCLASLLKKLLVFKDEIECDPAVLNQVLSSKFTSDLSPGMQKAFDVVISLIQTGPFSLKCHLLDNLRSCKNPEFVSKVSEIASSSLEKLLKGEEVVLEHITLLEASVKCLSGKKKRIVRGFFELAMQLLEGDLRKVGKLNRNRVLQCVLENFTDDTYQALSDEEKKKIVSKLVEVALKKELSLTRSVSECLRGLCVTSDVVETLFDLTKEEEEPVEPSRKKKKKLTVAVELVRLTFVLEFLHASENMDKGTEMCSFLGKALSHLASRENTDYACQLILTCLHRIITSLSAEEAKSYEKCLNIEALVQCLRKTSNFQTQQHIVLVMTAISPFFPDQLLNNIISIFAFMGDNFVQKDDAYSFQILTKLIDVALMAVINLPTDHPKKETSSINILRVFVDSRKHIPQHRLIPLFTQLLSIGVDEYLWKLVILTIESISLHKEEYKQKMASEYDLVVSLFSKYSVQTQLTSLASIVKFLVGYLEALDAKNRGSVEVLGPLVSTSTDTRFITLYLNKVVYNILSDVAFNRSFLKMLQEGGEEMEGKVFQGLVNILVQYILSISKKQKKIPHEMFWPALLKLVNLNLKRVNYLLPASVFVEVLECLLSQSIPTVKNKGLELLYAKLDLVDQGEFSATDYAGIVKLVPMLLANLQETHDGKVEENNPVLFIQQFSFLNLKILCKCYGAENIALFVDLPLLILNFLQDESNNIAVLDSALFCLSEVVVLMKSKVVPHLNKLMQALTGLFKRKEMLQKTISLDCLLSVFNNIIAHLGQFLSPFLDQLISQLCCLSADKVLLEKLNEKILVVARTVETRLLIPSLIKTYHSISTPSGFLALLHLLKAHVESAGKEQLVASSKIVTEFICLLLNLRNDAALASGEEVSQLEELYVDATLAFVVHLSEVSFRPLLEKLYNSMEEDLARTLTFFRLMCALSGKLKSIFNLFSGFLIKLVVKLLQQHNTSADDDMFESGVDQSCLLLRHMLRLVTMCYSCDVDGAFALSTGDVLFVPVVEQLENLKGDYEARVDAELIPCVVQICQSIKENNQLIALNKLICHKSKHEDWRVRMAAVKCLKALVESLGNLYEMLFPETASYLSELLDDDKEEVAQQSRLFKASLEKVIGNLDSFF